MSTRLDSFQQKKARALLRRELFWPLLLFGISGPVFLIYGCLHLASRTGWASLLSGFVFAVVGWGLFRCQSWARWPAAVILALNAIWALVSLVTDGFAWLPAVHLVIDAVFAIYFVQPTTGALFRAAGSEPEEPASVD